MQIQQPQIGQSLFPEDRFHLLDRLQLYDNPVLHQKIKSQWTVQYISFVVDRHFLLSLYFKTSLLQFKEVIEI